MMQCVAKITPNRLRESKAKAKSKKKLHLLVLRHTTLVFGDFWNISGVSRGAFWSLFGSRKAVGGLENDLPCLPGPFGWPLLDAFMRPLVPSNTGTLCLGFGFRFRGGGRGVWGL